ncbi:hypothetical protein LOK49_LG06G00343 [Camellia lanceoleosa]|uniref:Uncharacterized protein n=1 Tax=Camellia lanceoleosa TaxID=1840588 RepID=A0ACC0HDX4_9ERIC|nr:hypothetical protein LOK49_LG06G00343 [Camellia lanceoleosa]
MKSARKRTKMLKIEKGKKMKKLENFLFGSLYSPVEFGKEDDEELKEDGVDKGSALFFTDKSASSILLFMKRMQNSRRVVMIKRKPGKENPYGWMKKKKRPV